MKNTQTILDSIMLDVRTEVAHAQQERSIADIQGMTVDAPPVRSFKSALQRGFGIIAEIKERSPSHGPMRQENVAAAAEA